MKYIVIDEREHDWFTKEFENEEDAIKEATEEWNRMSDADKAHCKSFYVLESVNPDEEADDHLDGDYIWAAKE